jgi:hypothetical protein
MKPLKTDTVLGFVRLLRSGDEHQSRSHTANLPTDGGSYVKRRNVE